MTLTLINLAVSGSTQAFQVDQWTEDAAVMTQNLNLRMLRTES